jgi:hypothetical protein
MELEHSLKRTGSELAGESKRIKVTEPELVSEQNLKRPGSELFTEPKRTKSTAYERINHLTEILRQLQAAESFIPQKIVTDVQTYANQNKIDLSKSTVFDIRKILKKLSYKNYYEHAGHILLEFKKHH